MSEKITFFVLSTSGRPVRQISLSKLFLFFCCLLAVAAFAGAGLVLTDYYQLRQTAADRRALEQQVAGQQEVVHLQREQIQEFARLINTLKTKLIALNRFEEQIRIIANLDHPEAKEGLFGIGGSIPEDLDPTGDLRERHTALIREMHEQVDQIDQATGIQQDRFTDLIDALGEKKNILAATPAISPARGIITSSFGSRKSPFTGYREFHSGLDIAARIGTPVIASADGKITFTGLKGSYGKMMIVSHGHGLITRYAHLDDFLKKEGDPVKRGEKIALMGNTGRSTGPHVHYEVRLNGIAVDPTQYILD